MASLSSATVQTIDSYYRQRGKIYYKEVYYPTAPAQENAKERVLAAVKEVISRGYICLDVLHFKPPADDLHSRVSWIVKELQIRGFRITFEFINDEAPEEGLPPEFCKIVRNKLPVEPL